MNSSARLSTNARKSAVEPFSALSFSGLTRLSRFILHPLAFLLFPILLSLAPLVSHALTEGDYTYTTNSARQATITRFNSSYSGALSITNTLGGCTVTAIYSEAFRFCTGLTSVTIPDCIINMAQNAFTGCSGLVNINVVPTNPVFIIVAAT